MRFDLSRLGSTEFEHLVQALTMAEFGPGVGVFGSGADGGREATFDGPVPVTGNGHVWNGYGVIQAKYKETAATPKENATWLIAELKGEMAGWRTRKAAGRRTPSYYVVASNVRLSPQDDGGLDRVNAYFAEIAPELGLKGWLVWHFDVIGTQLARHAGIRTSYASWITPGDVLAAVLGAGDKEDQAFQEALTRFTAQELLRQRNVNLDQAGSADDRNVALADIFVDLPYQLRQPRPRTPGMRKVVASLIAAGDGRSDVGGLPVVEEGEGDSGKRFVLVGGPGQGKSTVTQFMCQAYRVAMLAGSPIARGADVKAACTKIRSLMDTEAVPAPRNFRWPVSIPLTRLADEHARGEVSSILGFIAAMIGKRCGLDVTTTQLRGWLRRYPWFVAFDGLDEVPAASNRAQVLALIDDFMVEAASVEADLLVMATTRPQGYTEEFSPAHYRHLHLAPLPEAVAMNYGKKLAVARHGTESDRADRLVERIKKAYGEPTTTHLMSSPLQVTILAVLLDRVGQAPKDRYTLFDEYYQVIYHRELEKDGQASALLRDHSSDVNVIHAQVGLLLQTRSEISGQTNSTLSVEELGIIVRERLSSEGHTGAGLSQLQEKVIKAATERLVFLVSGRADEIGFEIRSLQEFWAARGLMRGTEQQIAERLHCIAASAHWRNTVLFTLGHIFAKRETMRDTVVSLVVGLNSFTKEDHGLTHSVLLGSRLAVDVLADGMVRAPAYATQLASQALTLLRMPLDADTRNLGRCLPLHMAEALEQAAAERLASRGDFDDTTLIYTTAVFLDRAELPDAARTAMETLLAELYAAAPDAAKDEVLRQGHFDGVARLRALAAERLLEMPVDEVGNVVTSRAPSRGQNPGPAESGYPDWALDYVGVLVQIDDFHPIGACDWGLPDVNVDCGVVRVGVPDAHREVWGALDRSRPPKTTWLHEAARFIARPGRESLADFLASDSLDEASLLRILYKLPWVIGQVLTEEGSAAAAAEAVRRGDYGDLADWEELEASWGGYGRLTDVAGSLRDWTVRRLPVFPLVSACMAFGSPHGSYDDGMCTLFEAYDSLGLQGEVKGRFAALMMNLLHVPSHESSRLGRLFEPAVVEGLIQDASPRVFFRMRWVSSCSPLDRWKDVIAGCGRLHEGMDLEADMGPRLIEAWLAEPELWGLVPVASAAMGVTWPDDLREAVLNTWRAQQDDPSAWSREARDMAALAAALMSVPENRKEAQRLGECVVDAVRRDPGRTARVLLGAAPSRHSWRRVMLLLCAEGLRGEGDLRQALIQRLVEALAADPSGVAEVLGTAIPSIPHQQNRTADGRPVTR